MDPSNSSTSTDSKKRKPDDQNDIVSPPTLTSSDILKILQPFTHQQLSEIITTACLRHPDVISTIQSIADQDITQRYLHIKGLDSKTTSATLRSVFASYGELEEAMVILNKHGKSKRYGYVLFKHVDNALLALKQPSKLIDGTITITTLNKRPDNVDKTDNAQCRTVLVRGVGLDTSNETLLECFEKFGEIEKGPFTHKSGGCVVIVYKNVEGAKACCVENVKDVDGRKVKCKIADDSYKPVESSGVDDGPKPRGKGTSGELYRRVFIKNVVSSMCKERLLEYFGTFGEVRSGPFPTDKDTGKFTKDFAFVVYKDVEGAMACVAEPNKYLDGRHLYCKRACDYKKEKPADMDGLVKEVKVQGSVDEAKVIPEVVNSNQKSLMQGSFGSHFDSAGPSGVIAYGAVSGGLGEPRGLLSAYGYSSSELREPRGPHGIFGYGSSHIGDPGAHYDGRDGGRWSGFGTGFSGHVTSYGRMSSGGEAWSGDGFGGPDASYGGMGSRDMVGLGYGFGGSSQRSHYGMSPGSLRGYPDRSHYSLSSASAEQNQQQQFKKYHGTTYKL